MAIPIFNPKTAKKISPADAFEVYCDTWLNYDYPAVVQSGKEAYWFMCRSKHPIITEAVGPFRSIDRARDHLHAHVRKFKQVTCDGRK